MEYRGFLSAPPRGRLAPALLAGFTLSLLGAAWEPAASRAAASAAGASMLLYYLLYLAATALLAAISVAAGLRLASPPSGGSGLAGLAAIGGLVAAWLGLGGLLYGFARAPIDYSLGALLLVLAYAVLALHVWGLAMLALPLASRGYSHEAAGLAGIYSFLSVAGYDGYLMLSGASDFGALAVYIIGRAAPAFALGASVAYVALLSGRVYSLLYSLVAVLLLTVAPVTPSGGLIELGYTTVAALYAAPLMGYASVKLEALASRRPGLAFALALAALALVAAGILVYASGLMVWRPIAVVTGSMEPAIQKGDLVILERVSLEEVEVGDVVAFRVNSAIVVHRVVEKSGGIIVTKGDANEAPDPYRVAEDNLLGRVALVVPKAGWPVILVNWSPEVRLALILVAASVILILVFRLL